MNKLGLRAVAALGVGILVAGCAQFGSGDGPVSGPKVRSVPTVLVVDSSASMAEEDAPGPRIDAAKQAASALMEAVPDGAPTGLVAYGANTDDLPESQEVSCRDITVLQPIAEAESGGDISTAVNGLAPGGFTPIGRALEVAAAELAGVDGDGEKSIVLISDGEDTCGDPTPCEAARSIKQAQPEVVISTIGFKSDVEELACVARETGGLYLTADNVDQLVTRVLAAQNASAGESALAPTGRSGIELGQHVDEIASSHPEFPGLSDGTAESDLTVIHWVNCDWVFNSDGRLVEIRDPQGSTIDGLGVGGSADEAVELYGEPVETIPGSGGDWVGVYPASNEAGTAWRISYDSRDEIRMIVLCACLPGSGEASRMKGMPEGVPEWARQPGGPEVEILRPVDASGVVQPGWDVKDDDSQPCYRGVPGLSPSSSAVEPGTVICHAGPVGDAQHCWPDGAGNSALCLLDPFGRNLASISSPFPLAGQQSSSSPKVRAVELANGEKCLSTWGQLSSSIRIGDETYRAAFECSNGDAYFSNDGTEFGYPFASDGSELSIRYSTNYETVTDVVKVTKLIFLGTA